MKHRNLTSCAMLYAHADLMREHVRIPLPIKMKLTIKKLVKNVADLNQIKGYIVFPRVFHLFGAIRTAVVIVTT